jgi:thioredoxin-related protein
MMKSLLISLCVIVALSSSAQLPELRVESKVILPLTHIRSLDSLQNFNSIFFNPGQSCVVVYTFRGCKPCAVLTRELNRKIKKGEFAANQIVYVNSQVMDSVLLKNYLVAKNYKSPYYITQFFSAGLIESYPLIDAFDSTGNKVWSFEGYSTSVLRKIKKYLQ